MKMCLVQFRSAISCININLYAVLHLLFFFLLRRMCVVVVVVKFFSLSLTGFEFSPEILLFCGAMYMKYD